MCSSPKPRMKAKGKSASSASILSSMSAESRQRFTERANVAQERRDNIKKAEKVKRTLHQSHIRSQSAPVNIEATKRLNYWWLSISLKELFNLLFFGNRVLVKKQK
jgi:hypothetical protein